jgi:hypothetical protein
MEKRLFPKGKKNTLTANKPFFNHLCEKNMKFLFILASALPLILTTASSNAADTPEMASHHPTAQGVNAAPGKTPNANAMQNEKLDAQIKAMHAMHEKMINAKTAEARNALMQQQMKLMQDGMSLMGGMGAQGPMMGGMDSQGKMMNNMSGDMAIHQQMMEKRMGMMESMMQMMIDREASSIPPIQSAK